jgi:hypothetical protein
VTDLILVATGIAPEVSLAKEAGIKLGKTGAIATDGYGKTSIPDIYAAGDCAEVKHIVTGKPFIFPWPCLPIEMVGHWINYRWQSNSFSPSCRTAVVKVFQLEVATTGITSLEVARKHGFDPLKITIASSSRQDIILVLSPLK